MVCTRCQSSGHALEGVKQCAESSTCPAHAAKYNSIFNIINEDDFIPNFPLSQWYFTRYGRSTQNKGVSSGYATLWKNSWKDSDGAALGTEYMHMESPTAPLEEFFEAAESRNDCYEYLADIDGMVVLLIENYPSNTEGYYRRGNNDIYFHSPMFLMKYFVAVAAGEVDSIQFATLDLAPYLELAKWSMVSQIMGLTNKEDIQHILDTLSTLDPELIEDLMTINRFAHPHLPLSYCLLAMYIPPTSFN